MGSTTSTVSITNQQYFMFLDLEMRLPLSPVNLGLSRAQKFLDSLSRGTLLDKLQWFLDRKLLEPTGWFPIMPHTDTSLTQQQDCVLLARATRLENTYTVDVDQCTVIISSWWSRPMLAGGRQCYAWAWATMWFYMFVWSLVTLDRELLYYVPLQELTPLSEEGWWPWASSFLFYVVELDDVYSLITLSTIFLLLLKTLLISLLIYYISTVSTVCQVLAHWRVLWYKQQKLTLKGAQLHGSTWKGICHQTWWLAFDVQDPHGGRRKPIPENGPLTSTRVLWHTAVACAHSPFNKQI